MTATVWAIVVVAALAWIAWPRGTPTSDPAAPTMTAAPAVVAAPADAHPPAPDASRSPVAKASGTPQVADAQVAAEPAPRRARRRPKPKVAAAAPDAARPALPATVRVMTLDAGKSTWAHVTVDGRALGLSPVAAAKIPAGRHVFTAKRDGFRDAARTIDVVAGERAKVTLSLEAQ